MFNLKISNFRPIVISSIIDVVSIEKTFIPLRTNNKFLRANIEDIFKSLVESLTLNNVAPLGAKGEKEGVVGPPRALPHG